MKKFCYCLTVIIIYVFSVSAEVSAQSTAFTYQGAMNVSGAPANGSFDMIFRLFDAESGGNQLGTSTRTNVPVVNGNFAVTVDFGTEFSGASRFLEISVRPAGDAGGHTLLSPRTRVNSTPYAIKSLSSETAANATQLGGFAANQYVLTGDVRLSNARTPLPGSANYIQNTDSPQAADFNITGDGTVAGTLSSNIVSSATQYNIGTNRVLSVAGTQNVFAGVGAGIVNFGFRNSFFGSSSGASNEIASDNSFFGNRSGFRNTTGFSNSFFGSSAGAVNTTGFENSFFGIASGVENTSGFNNSFYGSFSGRTNSTGDGNSFFGRESGLSNTDGSENSFFGRGSGRANRDGQLNSFFGSGSGDTNTTGAGNAFFGASSGISNTTGTNNSFFGAFAGNVNTTGTNITIIGRAANVSVGNLSFATAIGASAIVSASNSVVLGRSVDDVGVPGRLGIGTTAPAQQLHIATNNGNMLVGGAGCPSGNVAIGLNGAFGSCTEYTVRGDGSSVYINRPTGGFVFFREGNGGSQVLINPGGALELRVLGAAGGTALCRNATQEVAFCSSSLRYKQNISSFAAGMSLVRQLQPIAYEWKDGGMKDVGFGAEDVAQIDSRLVTYNDKGEVEGIKYDRLSTAFVNAFTEQQSQIESQKAEIDALKSQLIQQKSEGAELKALVCTIMPGAAICSVPK